MSARPRHRVDMDALLDSLLPFAQQQLAKHGEFLPFGSVMTTAGDVTLVAGSTGDERPHLSS